MKNKKTLRSILGVAVVGALMAMPVGASAIVVAFLGFGPNFAAQTMRGTDVDSSWVDYFAFWNLGGTTVCAGPSVCWWVPAPSLSGSGNFRTYAATRCANGSSPATGWLENQGRIDIVCPTGINSEYGLFGVDAAPYGS